MTARNERRPRDRRAHRGSEGGEAASPEQDQLPLEDGDAATARSGTDIATTTAAPHTSEAPRAERGDRLALIADLLARAERSDSQAERELAMARAQKEAARHGIDLAEAAYANARAGAAPEPEERSVLIGKPRTAGLRTFAALYLAVAEVNGIKCLISRDASKIFAHGMPSDLDMAETLYASLVVQMEAGAQAWIDAGTWRSQHHRDVISSTGRPPAAPNAGVARRSFRRGFTARTSGLLLAAADEAKAEALAEARALNAGEALNRRADTAEDASGTAVTSTALALRAKEKAVAEFHRRRTREQGARGTWRPRGSESVSVSGYRAGERHAEREHNRARRK